MTRPGALESKKTLSGRLPETSDERVFEKRHTHLPDKPNSERSEPRPVKTFCRDNWFD
jgi:hypothetical protein